MIRKEIKLSNPKGIHARPSALIVKSGQKYKSNITIEKDGQLANAANIMEIIALGAQFGSQLVLTAQGEDEEAAMTELIDIFNRKFDDEPM